MFTAIKLLVVAAIWFKKIHSSFPKLYCYSSVWNLFIPAKSALQQTHKIRIKNMLNKFKYNPQQQCKMFKWIFQTD